MQNFIITFLVPNLFNWQHTAKSGTDVSLCSQFSRCCNCLQTVRWGRCWTKSGYRTRCSWQGVDRSRSRTRTKRQYGESWFCCRSCWKSWKSWQRMWSRHGVSGRSSIWWMIYKFVNENNITTRCGSKSDNVDIDIINFKNVTIIICRDIKR